MEENDGFTYPETNNPAEMFGGYTFCKWFRRRKNLIVVEPDFNAPYFRLMDLRFTVKNVLSVTVRIFRKKSTYEETVSDQDRHPLKLSSKIKIINHYTICFFYFTLQKQVNPMKDRFVLSIPNKGHKRVVRIEIVFKVNSGFEVCDFYIRGCHKVIGK